MTISPSSSCGRGFGAVSAAAGCRGSRSIEGRDKMAAMPDWLIKAILIVALVGGLLGLGYARSRLWYRSFEDKAAGRDLDLGSLWKRLFKRDAGKPED
jgi:hypothetical protein